MPADRVAVNRNIFASNFAPMMQRESAKTFEKFFKCPPPVPPKPKNYNNNNHQREIVARTMAAFDNARVEFEQPKRSKRDPPPVPPKPRSAPRPPSLSPERTSEPTLQSKQNLRLKNVQNGDESDKRRAMFIGCPVSSRAIFLPFAQTQTSSIDAFTTEDKDIFTNSRSLSIESHHATEPCLDWLEEIGSQTEENFEESAKLREECLEGIAEEEGDEVDPSTSNSAGACFDQPRRRRETLLNGAVTPPRRPPSGHLSPASSAFDATNQSFEPLKRVKLTGSVSFTSFDSVRNSSAKEVNLKKQIFKQLFERNERKTYRRDNLDELCLGEGNFSDEETNYEADNIVSPLSISQPDVSAVRTAVVEKLHRVALELLSTEESYVKRLHLIDQVFHFEILLKNRERNMFPREQLVQMFSNIKSIYEFHNDFLLVQLRKRLKEWDETPKIGDIMKRFAPFLKLYTEYVQNFDNAINVIKFWSERSMEFQNLLEKLQKRPECGQMSLQHHMLEPIQRVPRYLVLLKEYIKYLPDESSDRSDSIAALDLVQKAASHSNESLRACDQFHKMLAINERLGNLFNIIDPGRRFIKEGMLKRISPKDGSQTDRYLFLFHDILLVCQGSLKLNGKHQYKIKMKLDTSDLELGEDSHSLQTPESFHLFCKEKCLELLAQNKKLRQEWINAFNSCISSSKFRRSSAASQLSNEDLGKRAPRWTKNQETSMCMICTNNFSFFLKKKHCHACGIVVCTGCSPHKIQLEFSANKLKRVCLKCYSALHGASPPISKITKSRKCHSSLKMKAFDSHVLCGYLKISRDRKSWQDLYVTINEDFVLYTFKAHKDVKAHSSLPLPGYSVASCPAEPKIFIIFHKGRSTRNYFLSDSEDITLQWMELLKMVAKAELPQDFRGCRAQKCPHHPILL